MSSSQLDGIGSSISFLRRKITETSDGLVLTPAQAWRKLSERLKKSLELQDQKRFHVAQTFIWRTIHLFSVHVMQVRFDQWLVCAFNIGRERPDLMFTIKELSSSMASPTMTALQRFRKMIGYMGHVGNVGVKLFKLYTSSGTREECGWDQSALGPGELQRRRLDLKQIPL